MNALSDRNAVSLSDANASTVGQGGRGWVYVLANPAMPFRYKIGATTRHPHRRAAQLSRPTGVPAEFEVLYASLVDDPFTVEAVMHARYNMGRVNDRREFFVFTEREELLEACDWLADAAPVHDFIRHDDFAYWLEQLPARRAHA